MLLLTFDNIYWKFYPEKFNIFNDIVKENPYLNETKFKAECDRRSVNLFDELYQWICKVTPKLHDSVYSFSTRMYWLKHGLTDFPKCLNCGKKLEENIICDKRRKIARYRLFCSTKCQITSDHFKSSRISTWSQKYGIRIASPFQVKEVQKKMITTCLKKYGVKFPMQNKDIFESGRTTKLHRYGNKNFINREKAELTNLKNTGYKTPLQNPKVINGINREEWKRKQFETKRKNGTFKSSKTEDEAFELLKTVFPAIVRQHFSDDYPFNADFYDPAQPNVRFEFQGSWTHGKHPFDENCIEDQQTVSYWKSRCTKYFDNAIDTWTRRDVIKRRTAEINGIQLVEFWSIVDVQKFVSAQIKSK